VAGGGGTGLTRGRENAWRWPSESHAASMELKKRRRRDRIHSRRERGPEGDVGIVASPLNFLPQRPPDTLNQEENESF